MYDPERGWSLSFTGCGFLGFYHIGATCCLSERAPHLLRDARMFFGASAGALHCVTFLAGLPPGMSRAAAGALPLRVAGSPVEPSSDMDTAAYIPRTSVDGCLLRCVQCLGGGSLGVGTPSTSPP